MTENFDKKFRNMKDSLQTLTQLGLNEKTSEVYLSLFRFGPGTASEIALRSKIKRTTVYDCLDELSRNQLLELSFKGKRKIYAALNPNVLKKIPEKQISSINAILPELDALYQSNNHKPKVKYYEGSEGVKHVYDEILDLKPKEYFYFGGVKDMINVTGEAFMENYVKKRIEYGIWSNALRIRSSEMKAKYMKASDKNLRRVKLMPGAFMENTASVTMYSSKVAITSTVGENYAMVIESTEYYNMMMMVWHTLWKSLP